MFHKYIRNCRNNKNLGIILLFILAPPANVLADVLIPPPFGPALSLEIIASRERKITPAFCFGVVEHSLLHLLFSSPLLGIIFLQGR